MPRPLHSPEVKARAVALAVEHGPAEALRLLATDGVEIKPTTLRSWCSRAGVATVARERMIEASEQLRASREVRRERLADRLLEVAEMSTERAVILMDDAGLRDVVGLFTRAIHDHQLLTGAATNRTEHAGGKEAAHAVADELAARRGQAA